MENTVARIGYLLSSAERSPTKPVRQAKLAQGAGAFDAQHVLPEVAR